MIRPVHLIINLLEKFPQFTEVLQVFDDLRVVVWASDEKFPRLKQTFSWGMLRVGIIEWVGLGRPRSSGKNH